MLYGLQMTPTGVSGHEWYVLHVLYELMSFKRRPQGVAVAGFHAFRCVMYLVPDSRYRCWKRKPDYLAAALVHIWYRC